MAATRPVEVGKEIVYHIVTSPFLLITLNKRFGRDETNSLRNVHRNVHRNE